MQKIQFFRKTGVRLPLSTALFVLFSLSLSRAKDFEMPSAQAARLFPARDEHAQEKVTVAVDPYDAGEKTKIFSTDFRSYGFLPVFFIVTNDSDRPISLVGMEAQLITGKRAKLSPVGYEDLMRRMSHAKPKLGPSPLPLPGSKVKGAVNRKTREEIEQAQFAARAVEPHSTARGFLFFDISDLAWPVLPGAHFYLTGVRDAGGSELMYFEIPLDKYLSGSEVK
jgi:hypothetical protein